MLMTYFTALLCNSASDYNVVSAKYCQTNWDAYVIDAQNPNQVEG